MSDPRPVPPGAVPPGAPPVDYPPAPPLAPPPPPVPPGSPGSGTGREPDAPAGGATGGGQGSNRTRQWLVVAAMLAVLAVLAAALGLDRDGDGAGRTDAAGPSPGPSSPSPALPDPFDDPLTDPFDDPLADPFDPGPEPELDEVVAEIARFVEEHRGLRFRQPVEVELVGEDELGRRLLDTLPDPLVSPAGAALLRALGLVPGGADVDEAVRRVLGGGVAGYYDTETGELLVRGAEVTPYVRAVIAHELTHALDHQHLDLSDVGGVHALDAEGFGPLALAEGSAAAVEQAYRATFTAAEEAEAVLEELAAADAGAWLTAPPAVVELLVAPYVLGPALVERVVAEGGQRRLDAAFARPPATSEQVLDHDAYLAGEPALDVPPPPADGEVLGEGVLGALRLALLLGESFLLLPVPGLPPPSPGEAADGWGGDRFVAYRHPDSGEPCVRVNLVGDTPADTAEIADALAEWAEDPPAGVVAAAEPAADGSHVTLTSCAI